MKQTIKEKKNSTGSRSNATPAKSNTSASNSSAAQTENKSRNTDIADSPRDREKLQGDEATIDLPEVKDIPGQENIHVPHMQEYMDVRPSSADEEGEGLLDDLNDPQDDKVTDKEANVSKTEAGLLRDAAEFTPTEEELRLRSAGLDNTDDEGEPLNEKSFMNAHSGGDLDVPGAEDDDEDEEIGEEDEENNPYSVDRNNEDDDYDGK